MLIGRHFTSLMKTNANVTRHPDFRNSPTKNVNDLRHYGNYFMLKSVISSTTSLYCVM